MNLPSGKMDPLRIKPRKLTINSTKTNTPLIRPARHFCTLVTQLKAAYSSVLEPFVPRLETDDFPCESGVELRVECISCVRNDVSSMSRKSASMWSMPEASQRKELCHKTSLLIWLWGLSWRTYIASFKDPYDVLILRGIDQIVRVVVEWEPDRSKGR